MDSGRNSASIMAPSALREVWDRKSRFSAVLSVKAVRSDVIYDLISDEVPADSNGPYSFDTRPAAGVSAHVECLQ